MRLFFFGANNAWAFVFGKTLNTARPTQLHGFPIFFSSRSNAVEAARLLGLAVDRKGNVTVSKTQSNPAKHPPCARCGDLWSWHFAIQYLKGGKSKFTPSHCQMYGKGAKGSKTPCVCPGYVAKNPISKRFAHRITAAALREAERRGYINPNYKQNGANVAAKKMVATCKP